jgi:hypothetical protein
MMFFNFLKIPNLYQNIDLVLKPPSQTDPQALFASLEGKGGFWNKKKRKEQVEEMKDNGKAGIWGGFVFLHNIKSSSFGELKNCI